MVVFKKFSFLEEIQTLTKQRSTKLWTMGGWNTLIYLEPWIQAKSLFQNPCLIVSSPCFLLISSWGLHLCAPRLILFTLAFAPLSSHTGLLSRPWASANHGKPFALIQSTQVPISFYLSDLNLSHHFPGENNATNVLICNTEPSYLKRVFVDDLIYFSLLHLTVSLMRTAVTLCILPTLHSLSTLCVPVTHLDIFSTFLLVFPHVVQNIHISLTSRKLELQIRFRCRKKEIWIRNPLKQEKRQQGDTELAGLVLWETLSPSARVEWSWSEPMEQWHPDPCIFWYFPEVPIL